MKTVIAKTTVVLAILASGAMAQAAPAWLCNLNFQGKSKSVQVLIGVSEFNGTGTVRCIAPNHAEVEYPVTVTMKSKPLAPRIGLGKFEIYGEALQVAVSSANPEALLGKYLVAEARAGVGAGAGAIVAVHAQDKTLSLTLSLQVVKGFGVELGFRTMKIELDQSRM